MNGAPSRAALLATWCIGVALAAAGATGALTPVGIDGLPDPGGLTRIGLPLIQALRDLAALTTVGLLVLASTCLGPDQGRAEASVTGVRQHAAGLARIGATMWLLADIALSVLVYSDASGARVGSKGFWDQAVFFASTYELGQYLLWGAVLAGATAITSALASSVVALGAATALAIAGLWPIALTGHAAGTLRHVDAVNLQMFHLLGLGVWAGGLIGLVLLRKHLGEQGGRCLIRFSSLATGGLALVLVSGVLGAVLRLPSLGAIASPYGALLMLKTMAVVVLIGLGRRQRSRLAAGWDPSTTKNVWRTVAVEAVVLTAAVGLGVALSRTATPPPAEAPRPLTAAESLLGASMPPPLDGTSWLLGWSVDTMFLPLGLAAIFSYLWAVRRLSSRGVSWPWSRSAFWLIGWALFLWATNGPPGTYSRVLFSMHMVQHMTIATAVPVFLVLAAPVTLALRTLRRRDDDSRGTREWLLQLIHSLPMQLLGHPVVASGMFVVGMVAFYYSSAFEMSLETHTGHVLMTAHFLVSGYLFAECLIGVDPGLRRPAYPLRALLVMVTFGFHALFAVSLMASSQILAENWYGSLGRTWGASLADDQYLGASIGWLLGEYPLAVIAAALLVSWFKADGRERRRFDRSEAREGDRQLKDYNAFLARLSASAPTMERTTAPVEEAQEADRT